MINNQYRFEQSYVNRWSHNVLPEFSFNLFLFNSLHFNKIFNMKYLTLAFLAVAIVVCSARPDEPRYTTKYDSIDLEQILKSDRLFKNYYNCLMDNGKCTPDGSELKRLLPDALRTNCAKCSERQRDGTDRVIRFLIEKKPQQWKSLQEKYDPEDIYINKYKSEAESRGIQI